MKGRISSPLTATSCGHRLMKSLALPVYSTARCWEAVKIASQENTTAILYTERESQKDICFLYVGRMTSGSLVYIYCQSTKYEEKICPGALSFLHPWSENSNAQFTMSSLTIRMHGISAFSVEHSKLSQLSVVIWFKQLLSKSGSHKKYFL